MRREELHLAEILDSADMVARWLDGVDLDRWEEDEILRDAVLHRVMLVGEGVSRLSPELKSRHSDIPWSRIVGFRNTVIHQHFAVEWPIVWDVATNELPALRPLIAAILELEFPEAWQLFLEGD